MSQGHFVESVKDDQDLDPQFKSLLRHHWMEEAQHAKLDTLMVEALAEGRTKAGLLAAVEEYMEIGGLIDPGLKQQVEFDPAALTQATGRGLSSGESEKVREVQLKANRWTYLGSGLTHPNFLATLERMLPEARDRVEHVAPAFC